MFLFLNHNASAHCIPLIYGVEGNVAVVKYLHRLLLSIARQDTFVPVQLLGETLLQTNRGLD
jgi:hypothetical protein